MACELASTRISITPELGRSPHFFSADNRPSVYRSWAKVTRAPGVQPPGPLVHVNIILSPVPCRQASSSLEDWVGLCTSIRLASGLPDVRVIVWLRVRQSNALSSRSRLVDLSTDEGGSLYGRNHDAIESTSAFGLVSLEDRLLCWVFATSRNSGKNSDILFYVSTWRLGPPTTHAGLCTTSSEADPASCLFALDTWS